jgi:hypothetical protein
MSKPKTCNKPRRIRKGEPGKSRIKKSNPERRKSFRKRHGCDKKSTRANKLTAKYWSCKKW